MKLFQDRHEMYVDSEDEEGEGSIPVSRTKDTEIEENLADVQEPHQSEGEEDKMVKIPD